MGPRSAGKRRIGPVKAVTIRTGDATPLHVGVVGHGLHKDRIWSEVYESLSHPEDEFVIDPCR